MGSCGLGFGDRRGLPGSEVGWGSPGTGCLRLALPSASGPVGCLRLWFRRPGGALLNSLLETHRGRCLEVCVAFS